MDTFDFYGVNYQLRVLNKPALKTNLSFFSSLLTLGILGIAFWLLGKDFYLKTNPRVISSTKINDNAEKVYVNNQNFTIAFRLENSNGEPVPEDQAIAFPYYGYYKYERIDGYYQATIENYYFPKLCKDTTAKDNPLLKNLAIDTLYCIDIDRIKEDIQSETDLALYGSWDENVNSHLYIAYTNCKYGNGVDLDFCLSFEEASKRNALDQYISIYTPRSTFDPENIDNPFKAYYDNLYFQIDPYTKIKNRINFTYTKLLEDKGWMFEDIEELRAIELLEQVNKFGFNQKEAFEDESGLILNSEIMFPRKQVQHVRSYMKLQELAANLGGIIKSVMLFFTFINKFYANWKIEVALIEKHFDKDVQNVSSSLARVNNRKENVKITFKEYFLLSLNQTKGLNAQNRLLNELRKELDIENLLKIRSSTKEPRIEAQLEPRIEARVELRENQENAEININKARNI